MAKRRKKAPLVPRLGPPENLRPAGAHADKRRKTRGETTRTALREEAVLDSLRDPADTLV
jgi:hypothetical protein